MKATDLTIVRTGLWEAFAERRPGKTHGEGKR